MSNFSQLIKDGWFTERAALWPGQSLSLQVKEVLCHFQSEYQNILIFESLSHGRVLVLDGVVQLTERDEFAYQEMMAHTPLNSHKKPSSVLIIGGGDGAVLREVLKHEEVEKVILCDIDEAVVEATKKYLPNICQNSYSHPKVQVIHQDGAKFLEDCEASDTKFDVVIVDSSDPEDESPAVSLYNQSFCNSLKNIMNKDAVVVQQGESVFLHLNLIGKFMEACGNVFEKVDYYYTMIPTYPSGTIGFVICSNDKTCDLRKIVRATGHLDLKYYTAQIHEASFVLPKFASDSLKRYIK